MDIFVQNQYCPEFYGDFNSTTGVQQTYTNIYMYVLQIFVRDFNSEKKKFTLLIDITVFSFDDHTTPS